MKLRKKECESNTLHQFKMSRHQQSACSCGETFSVTGRKSKTVKPVSDEWSESERQPELLTGVVLWVWLLQRNKKMAVGPGLIKQRQSPSRQTNCRFKGTDPSSDLDLLPNQNDLICCDLQTALTCCEKTTSHHHHHQHQEDTKLPKLPQDPGNSNASLSFHRREQIPSFLLFLCNFWLLFL